jgi:N-acetyltransferase
VKIEPVTLRGQHVRLEPLTVGHVDALCEVGLDEQLWRWTTVRMSTPDDILQYVNTALEWQKAGTALPFVTVLEAEQRVVGSTRFANIDVPNRRAEIGWTWVARPWQRSVVNTQAKYLMLRHAFETLGCIRVEFKTDRLNETSRKAIARLGATEEGTLRSHMIVDTGRIRDSVYFSIIEREWPGVKGRLETRMAAGGR